MAACRGLHFHNLPDVVLLSVLQNLQPCDLINVMQVDQRLKRLCGERSVVRHSSFEGSYRVREEDLKFYISNACHGIDELNLNHCYWLPQRAIHWAASRCKDLKELHVIECKMKTDTLVSIISSTPSLTSLSFSITTFADVKRDIFIPAKDTLANLQKLIVYFTSLERVMLNYLGENNTILDFCENLEDLHIGSAGMAVPELYRPILSHPEKLNSLKAMSITYNIHAGAQMFFYGTLSQLPTDKIRWTTLLMPNVNFMEFLKKAEYMKCLEDVRLLQNLDVSGSKVMCPNNIEKAISLRYLNLKCSLINSAQLLNIASSCTQLTSVNLNSCSDVLKKKNQSDGSGLMALFSSCPNMKHLNLAGEHHHINTNIELAVSSIKGLTSLALPACLLCKNLQTSSRPSKRIMSCRPGNTSAPKRRLAHTGPVDCFPSTSSGSGGSSPTYSTRCNQEGALMRQLISQNLNLVELEIIAVRFHSVFERNRFIHVNLKNPQFNPCVETRFVRDYDLDCICQLKQLRRLTLAGLPGLISGQSIESITGGCEKLEYLSLAYLGGSLFSSALCNGLRKCHHLKDLRIEQPHMSLGTNFFESLMTCQRLERLCVIAKHSTFQPHDIVRMTDQLRHLCVLQFFPGGTLTACKTLSSLLQKRHIKTRPGLSICIHPLLHDALAEVTRNIPAQHLEQLLRFDSHVCLVPPNLPYL